MGGFSPSLHCRQPTAVPEGSFFNLACFTAKQTTQIPTLHTGRAESSELWIQEHSGFWTARFAVPQHPSALLLLALALPPATLLGYLRLCQ